jgi:AcrR family transcriptional regulator
MRLIRAAVDLFAEKGYASTPVREIVERAGVTKPVLYYYFKNKEGLFVAILDWASELQEDLLKKLFESSDNTLARFIDLYREIYKELRERGNLFKMINNFVFGPPQGIPVSLFDRFHRKMVEAIKMIYEKGLAKNEVRREDPEDVALVVLGLLNTSLHLDNLFPEMEDPERPGRLLTMAFNGLAVPRSP